MRVLDGNSSGEFLLRDCEGFGGVEWYQASGRSIVERKSPSKGSSFLGWCVIQGKLLTRVNLRRGVTPEEVDMKCVYVDGVRGGRLSFRRLFFSHQNCSIAFYN